MEYRGRWLDEVEYRGRWLAEAEYADGTTVEEYFSYYENGNYEAECKRQHELEEWLIGLHPECTWYSVSYVD